MGVHGRRTRSPPLRELLSSTAGSTAPARSPGPCAARTTTPRGLLLVGTPDEEPWHLTAHLSDEARCVRHPRARSDPGPLAGPRRRAAAPVGHPGAARGRPRRGETVLVVAEDAAPDPLLERAWDARKLGATVLVARRRRQPSSQGVAHESLTVVHDRSGRPRALLRDRPAPRERRGRRDAARRRPRRPRRDAGSATGWPGARRRSAAEQPLAAANPVGPRAARPDPASPVSDQAELVRRLRLDVTPAAHLARLPPRSSPRGSCPTSAR